MFFDFDAKDTDELRKRYEEIREQYGEDAEGIVRATVELTEKNYFSENLEEIGKNHNEILKTLGSKVYEKDIDDNQKMSVFLTVLANLTGKALGQMINLSKKDIYIPDEFFDFVKKVIDENIEEQRQKNKKLKEKKDEEE